MHRLFDELAHRYDLHTPPDHYQHDHVFVLQQAASLGNPCRMLDIGCGTGVLVAKARQAGVLARGIDSSAAMNRIAEARAGASVVTTRSMQELDEVDSYDLVVSLSWTLNYCASRAEMRDILERIHRSLRPGGRALLQVAHAPHVDGQLFEDQEQGPQGVPGDITFSYRFTRLEGDEMPMEAEYRYECQSLGERLHETHILRVTDARVVAAFAAQVGFGVVEIFDSWRGDPLRSSASPFVCVTKTPEP